MEETAIRASKKRKLLALYLDFILFMVLWGLLEYSLTGKNGLPLWMALAVFALVETAMYRLLGSPGRFMLSIGRNGSVDPHIYAWESWLTILLGILLVLEGTKKLVRWTQILVPVPFFGFIPEAGLQILMNVAVGGLFVVTGFLFLKLHRVGFILGLVTSVGVILSCVLSWPLWDEVVEEMVVARRELRGLPVRENEVDFMQALVPEGIVILAAVFCLAMAFTYKRFTSFRSRVE